MSVPLMSGLDPQIAARLKRDRDGLVPAVVQQHDTGEVLMLAWMNDAALHATLTTGRATYWSRSRQALWVKGDTSGHVQAVRGVALDCDGDTLLIQVDQTGPACHTGNPTCFADVLLADYQPVGDQPVGDQPASDRAASDRAVSDRAVSDLAVSDPEEAP